MRTMKTTEDQEKFIELRAKNYSFDKIAEELDVSKPTLIEWADQFNDLIGNLKAIELEALQEKYFLTKKAKMELFGDKLEAIKEELESRIEKDALEELETAELFKLFFEFTDRLEEEKVKTTFSVERDGDGMPEIDFSKKVFTAE